MEKWLQKIYNNWLRYLGLFLIVIVVFLLSVHIMFKWKSGIALIEAEWSAGDILSFGGAILSFLGTVILGCITAKISIENNNINNRLVEIESKREQLERDKRLGYIIAEQLKISFHELITEENECGSESHGWQETIKCTSRTDTIIFNLKMKLTAESIINRITCKSIKIYERGIEDDIYTMSCKFCWTPFYIREENFVRGINQIDKSFEEIIILSKSDRDTTGFIEMKKIMSINATYMIRVEFEYVNILQEEKNIALQLECCQNRIIKSEIVL